MFVDFMRYLPDDLLFKVDIASMAHGLECRAPFLDHKLVEFIGRIPTDLKLRGFTTKYLLRRAFGEMLPAGNPAPAEDGVRSADRGMVPGELRGYLRETLLDPAALRRGYFAPESVRHSSKTTSPRAPTTATGSGRF